MAFKECYSIGSLRKRGDITGIAEAAADRDVEEAARLRNEMKRLLATELTVDDPAARGWREGKSSPPPVSLRSATSLPWK